MGGDSEEVPEVIPKNKRGAHKRSRQEIRKVSETWGSIPKFAEFSRRVAKDSHCGFLFLRRLDDETGRCEYWQGSLAKSIARFITKVPTDCRGIISKHTWL